MRAGHCADTRFTLSTALLQTVLRRQAPEGLGLLSSSLLGPVQFSSPDHHTVALVRGKFLLTPDASIWDAHMPLQAMVRVVRAHTEHGVVSAGGAVPSRKAEAVHSADAASTTSTPAQLELHRCSSPPSKCKLASVSRVHLVPLPDPCTHASLRSCPPEGMTHLGGHPCRRGFPA
jgi:hypothetical protein